jgi:ABC-type molybdate transport system substrate-binding protein
MSSPPQMSGHARKLVDDGRASVMAVFARNTVCLLSPAAFGATTDTALDRLLALGARVGVSPPKIDLLGDYTVRLFEVAERLRPGSRATLQARAVVLDTPPGSPPPKSGDTDADAILNGRVDGSIVYGSGRDRYARLLPGAKLIEFPPKLQVGPEYGLAVMKDAWRRARKFLRIAASAPGGTRSNERTAKASVGTEVHRDAVDAIALMGRRRTIREHVPQVAATVGAMDLGSDHTVAVIDRCPHRTFDRIIEARPSCAAFKLQP